jgi:predicted RNase H-like nuclease (RuvC/YqgF family)
LHAILAEWDDQVAQQSTADPEATHREGEIHELRIKLATKTRECTDLHRRLDAATTTTAIAALHHDNTLLRQELAHHRADVIPIRPAT